jgi:hypothetical protein
MPSKNDEVADMQTHVQHALIIFLNPFNLLKNKTNLHFTTLPC